MRAPGAGARPASACGRGQPAAAPYAARGGPAARRRRRRHPARPARSARGGFEAVRGRSAWETRGRRSGAALPQGWWAALATEREQERHDAILRILGGQRLEPRRRIRPALAPAGVERLLVGRHPAGDAAVVIVATPAEQLVDRHALRASLDPGVIDFPADELVADGAAGEGRDEHTRTVGPVQGLEARGEVHVVTHGGVAEAL